jgi:integrase
MGGSVIQDKRDEKYHISIYWEKRRYKIFKHPVTGEPFYNRKQAEKQLSRIRTEIDDGTFQPRAWLPDKPLSTRQYCKTWLKDLDVSKKTKIGYATAVKRYIIPFFKDKDIRNIRFNDIKNFKKQLPLSDKGIYNTVGVLKTLLREAFRNEDIPRIPPFPKLSLNDDDNIEYLEIEEQDRILEKIPGRHRPIFQCGMEYGLRTQEVRAIQKDCIRDGVLIIRRKFSENKLVETTKTGIKGIRRFEITPYFQGVLDSIEPHLSPFVFVRDDSKPYTNKNLNKIWHEAEEKAGIKCKLQNAFRHSLGCQLLDQGEELDLVRQALGHTNNRMTRKYATRKAIKVTEALNRRRSNVVSFRQELGRKKNESEK